MGSAKERTIGKTGAEDPRPRAKGAISLDWRVVLIVLLVGGLGLFMVSDSLRPQTPQTGDGTAAGRGGGGGSPATLDMPNPYPLGPAWSSYQGVINGPGGDQFSSEQLEGKIVLVDFWTYSCINCIRSVPHIQSLYETYKDRGLVVVGVHTPEFEFEKERANVEEAVRRYGLTYPVVLDGDRRIWGQFRNSYWPRQYLIDRQGRLVYDHIGEGGYEETEMAVRAVLARDGNMSAAAPMAGGAKGTETVDFLGVRTPELYFGSSFRRAPLGNTKFLKLTGEADYALPEQLQPDLIYLGGHWKDEGGDSMEMTSAEGDIAIDFSAQSLYLVADSPAGSEFSVTLDGQAHRGPDADAQGVIKVGASRLYRLAKADGYGRHKAAIHIRGAGLRAYAFTFG